MPKFEARYSDVARFESALQHALSNPELRFEPTRFFSVDRNAETGLVSRAHYMPLKAGKRSGFRTIAEAIYLAGYNLPQFATKLIDVSKPVGLRSSIGSNMEEIFYHPGDRFNNYLMVSRGLKGAFIDAHVDLNSGKIESSLRTESGTLRTGDFFYKTPEGVSDPNEYWKYKGIIYDANSEKFTTS